MELAKKEVDDLLDKIELSIEDNLASHTCEVKHIFTKGMYSRAIFMPKGNFLTSKEHNTEHQYVISAGVVRVYENGQTNVLIAPAHGITVPATRRLLYIEEDTIWTTFHPIPWIEGGDYTEAEVESILMRIEKEIINKRVNKLLSK